MREGKGGRRPARGLVERVAKDEEGAAEKTVFHTPLGWVGVAASERGICNVVLPETGKKAAEKQLKSEERRRLRRKAQVSRQKPGATIRADVPALKEAEKRLMKYFSGKLVAFDLPLDLRYYTDFQRAVWKATAEIPPGKTRSYAWIAKRIRRPRASRAVGQALGANPVPIMIPCHRVISSTGTLGGFSGGIGMKKRLLNLEEKLHNNRRTR